jgi:threonine dehydratase
MEFGSVLCCFELEDSDVEVFNRHLEELNYDCHEVTQDLSYVQFLNP